MSLLLGALLSDSAVPPGADPGHMLALSYAFDAEAPEGPLAYPPGLPFLMFALRHLAGSDVDLLFVLIKVLGIALFLFQAAGLAFLASAIGDRSAAVWTFVLAALTPAVWNQVAWGGYAQLLGVGLGSAGLGSVIRTANGEKRTLLSGVFLGSSVLVHHYSAFFFIASAIVIVIRSYRRGHGKQFLFIGLSASLTAALSIPAYHQMWMGLHEKSQSLAQIVECYGVAFAVVIQNVVYHPITNGLVIVILTLTLVAGKRSNLETFRLVTPLGWGCLALLVVTPPLQVARAGIFASHALAVFMGITLSRTPTIHLKKLVAACLVILPIVTFFDLSRLVPHYAPINKDDVNTMLDLGRTASGRTLIVSPNPNIDGWWFEGLTGRSALIGDHLKWYVLDEQRRMSIDARVLAQASRTLDGGSLKILTSNSAHVLWALDEVEFYPLLRFTSTNKNEVQGSPGDFQLTSARSLDIEPSPGVILREISRDGATFTLRCEYLYEHFRPKGISRTVILEFLSDPWDASVADQKIRIESSKQISMKARVDGLRPSGWRLVLQDELITKRDISHILVRGAAIERFQRHPRFEFLWTRGQMTVFRVLGP